VTGASVATSVTVGVVLAVVAAVGLAAQGLAVRVGTADQSVETVLAVVFGLNLSVVLPLAAVSGASQPTAGFTPTALAAFAVAGILGSLLGRACYFIGIARLGASRAEPLRAVIPLFALAGAWLVLDEPITPTLIGGVVLLVVGGTAVAAEARTSPVTADSRQFWIDISFPLVAALLCGIDPVVTKFGFAERTPLLVGGPLSASGARGRSSVRSVGE
jgi:drug/metabolite transporter (DMT)-like permease